MPGIAPPPDVHDDVREYLRVLAADESTSLYWTTFDDKRRRRDLDFTTNASLAEVGPRLRQLNAMGAGVFVCVGRVRGPERLRQNVQSVNVLLIDLDGAALPSDFGEMPLPNLVVETSPGRWHVYWMLPDMPIDTFEIMQRKLAIRFHGDRSVSFLEQIIRVPGFLHQKKEPFLSRVTLSRIDSRRYAFVDIAYALKDIDIMSVQGAGPHWIRDRVTGEIIDYRFKHFAVWSEVLKFSAVDSLEIAARAWRVCESQTDVSRARPISTPEELQTIAHGALLSMGGRQ